MPRWIAVLLILTAGLLAACAGRAAAPAPPAELATPTPEVMPPPAESSAGGASFEVVISGDFDLNLTSALGSTLKLFSSDAGGLFYYVQFGDEFGLPIVLISFFGEGGVESALPKPGTFTLSPLRMGELMSADKSITATATLVSDERDANNLPVVYSFDQSTGSLTIAQDDGGYSGSFEFTLQGRAAAAIDYTKTVTVTGTFSGVQPE
ncbi:MAG: hypothetical protein JNM70_00020 [Anaerolineae bacterium]|nr:hypothetical protein [Anaerolineae bacterium]